MSREEKAVAADIVHHARHGTGQVAGNPLCCACTSTAACPPPPPHGGLSRPGGCGTRRGESRANHQSSGLQRALNARLQRCRVLLSPFMIAPATNGTDRKTVMIVAKAITNGNRSQF